VFYFALFSLMGALVWMTPTGWSPITADNTWPLGGVGVMGTAGQLAMTRAYGRGKTLVTATLSYSGIVFSSALGIVIWHDVLGLASWLGITLIVAAGIIAVQLAPGAKPEAGPQVTND
jgi:S-adenosylmethionine uptake transporter